MSLAVWGDRGLEASKGESEANPVKNVFTEIYLYLYTCGIQQEKFLHLSSLSCSPSIPASCPLSSTYSPLVCVLKAEPSTPPVGCGSLLNHSHGIG